jgi:biotin carboxylase
MDNVIFTAPILNPNAIPTIKAVLSVPDTQVSVISQDAASILPNEITSRLKGFHQVANALDVEQLFQTASAIQQKTGQIHRMFAANEQVQVQVAIVRERLGITGMSSETMRNFRDKALMKTVLANHGLPCARHQRIERTSDAWAFLKKTGYPVVVKPPEGAGAEFTYKVENDQMMHSVLHAHPPSPDKPLMAEEYITGEEFSFDAFTIKGEPKWHSISKYLPAPLEVKRNAWIQWRVVIPREVESAQYDDIRAVAFDALKALGAQTGISHMEWFRHTDGRVIISEVGMRPPGAQFTTLMSRANEFDCMGAWARLMIKGEFTAPQRKYACGCAYLRGQGSGVVKQVSGFEKIQKDLGNMITDYRMPTYGQKPNSSYEGEGFVIVRHPQTVEVEKALLHIVSTVKVALG